MTHFEDGMPVFGEIITPIGTPLQECLFVMRPLVAEYFDRHFHAYHVILNSSQIVVYRHFQFHDHQVLHTNRIHSSLDDSLYVHLEYHVFE